MGKELTTRDAVVECRDNTNARSGKKVKEGSG